ncbi:zinc metallochaperone AztD [Microbacterium sp. TNHR37B]|uniref:zinc metallochaperone AztD n=1 Tax=Microbacterium sp. TNHR37B TaxID=1775956 RepID=UPI0007B29993|nr:zinc metallochaperone AztD [Microbacterium sp. TNHR37B]KZE88698.1 hypothetical protein AVP41_03205 [Microbacterium sp. TNHR37B]
MKRPKPTATAAAVATLAVAAVAVTACAGPGTSSASPSEPRSSAPAADGPRVAVAYAGGVLVLDGDTLEVVADEPSEEFVRLNLAGDDRHAFVTTSQGFQLLDLRAPELTDLVVDAGAAGHVVRHAGKTVLYDDATSDTTVFDTADLASVDGALPDARVIPGVAAHHGVSVVLTDGSLLTTVGDESARTGIRVTDAAGAEIAASDDCPGVHGEGTAKGEAVVVGCEDGVLVYREGTIAKLDSPDAYGRIGNAYVSEESPLVVMDYKDDPDAEGYLLHRLALVDTEALTLKVVDLPEGVEYTWRGVARGHDGEALLLGSDGRVHVIDPATGQVIASHEAIDPWRSPAEWQDEHPALAVAGEVRYVTDAERQRIVALDVHTGEWIADAALPVTPNEIVAID